MKLICLLDWNVSERHEILDNSIGVLPEEQEAFDLIQMIVILSFPILIFASLIQFSIYFIYNKYFHPFKDITSSSKQGNFI